MKKITITAGGTGGHVYPGFAIAHILRKKNCQITWAGSKQGIENDIVPQQGYPLWQIQIQGLKKNKYLSLLQKSPYLIRAVSQAIAYLHDFKPNAVFSLGGYASMPASFAACLLNIPLFIHEQNSVAGFTNRCFAPFAKQIFTAFPHVFKKDYPTQMLGNPLHQHLAPQAWHQNQKLNKYSKKIHVLILGGSQGAQTLNQHLPPALKLLVKHTPLSIWHQTGKKNLTYVEKQYQALNLTARISAFIDPIQTAYTWADLVICRAGAMTLSEIMAFGLASLLIPYPKSADNHQLKNAQYLEKKQAAMILDENKLTTQTCLQALEPLIMHNKLRSSLSKQAFTLSKPRAAYMIAQHLIDFT